MWNGDRNGGQNPVTQIALESQTPRKPSTKAVVYQVISTITFILAGLYLSMIVGDVCSSRLNHTGHPPQPIPGVVTIEQKTDGLSDIVSALLASAVCLALAILFRYLYRREIKRESITPTKPLLACTIIFVILTWCMMQGGADGLARQIQNMRMLNIPYSPVLSEIYRIAPLVAAIGWMFARRRFPILSIIVAVQLSSCAIGYVHADMQRHLVQVPVTRWLSSEERETLARLPFRTQEQCESYIGQTIMIENNPDHLRELCRELESLHVLRTGASNP